MRILALDLGTHTGWASRTTGGVVESGVQDFTPRRGESAGIRYLHFRRWLEEIVGLVRPHVIAYEMPHLRGGHAATVLAGLQTRVEEIAAHLGLELLPVHTGTLKKHATGRGNANKSDMLAAACARWGRRAYGEDEADALCVLAWAIDEVGALR